MKYLVDNQLPVALARILASQGIDCLHVQDVELGSADDAEIWAFAIAHARIVISKDQDFLYLALRPDAGTQFVWVRIGNCRRLTLFAAVARVWPDIEASLSQGDRVVELR